MACSSTTRSRRCLALIVYVYIFASFTAQAFSSHRTDSIATRARHGLYSSKDDTDNLLEKARRLREEVLAIESSKLVVQREKDAEEQGRLAEEREKQIEKEQMRLRYSAEVPILKVHLGYCAF